MTQVNKTNATERTAQQQKEVKPQLKPEKRIEVFEGMLVEDVEKNGSEAQKIVAKAFDSRTKESDYEKGDGTYNEREASNLNNYRFALDKTNRELRAHNIETGGHVTIKYNDLKELKEKACLVRQAGHFEGNAVFNLRNKTAVYEDVTGFRIIVPRVTVETITIRNANVKNIDAYFYDGDLKLENVADVGTLWDSKTRVLLDKNTNISVDANSKIEIKRRKED